MLWSKARKKTSESRESRHRSIRSQKIALSLSLQKRRAKRPLKRETGTHAKYVEGARQKPNGKWANYCLFPGREFNDLDAYRAAKKQRAEQRAAYSAQLDAYTGS